MQNPYLQHIRSSTPPFQGFPPQFSGPVANPLGMFNSKIIAANAQRFNSKDMRPSDADYQQRLAQMSSSLQQSASKPIMHPMMNAANYFSGSQGRIVPTGPNMRGMIGNIAPQIPRQPAFNNRLAPPQRPFTNLPLQQPNASISPVNKKTLPPILVHGPTTVAPAPIAELRNYLAVSRTFSPVQLNAPLVIAPFATRIIDQHASGDVLASSHTSTHLVGNEAYYSGVTPSRGGVTYIAAQLPTGNYAAGRTVHVALPPLLSEMVTKNENQLMSTSNVFLDSHDGESPQATHATHVRSQRTLPAAPTSYTVEAYHQPAESPTKLIVQQILRSEPKSHRKVVIEHTDWRYEGEKLSNQRHGKGILYFPEGGKYEGEWRNDNMEGRGKFWLGNGHLLYEGEFVKGRFHGYGIIHNQRQENQQAPFDYGDFDLLGDRWARFEGEFRGGARKRGFLHLTNGEKLQCEFKENKANGPGKYHRKNGEVVSGTWASNKLVELERIQG